MNGTAVALAPAASATPRSGDHHIVKGCSAYTGQAGSFCTITSSNLRAIPPGARVVYGSAAGATAIDTDISLVAGPGNVGSGHCRFDFLAMSGVCALSGGMGRFTHLHARVAVTPAATPSDWLWDGTFAFR